MNIKEKTKRITLLLMPFVFYIFFAIYDGPIWCKDSFDYANLTGTREPLYPLFVNLIKLIFGLEKYLFVTVFFQSIFIAIVTYVLVKYVNDNLSDNYYLSIIIELILLSVSLLCRFVAKRGSMYSNCILSEAIAYPLYILFIRYILDYLLSYNKKPLVISIILSFLLVSTRKQLFSSLFILLISIVYVLFKTKVVKKNILNMILCVFIIFGGSKLFDYGYMNISQGINGTHTGDNRFITTMIIYTADKEDSRLIKDKEVKDLFIEIYDVCEEKGYIKDDSIKSWYNRVSHFSKHYDNIQIDTLTPILKEHAGLNTSINTNVLIDNYNNVIISSLLFKELPKILLLLIDNIFAGLMITVSADKKIFIIYSILIYAFYIYLLIKNTKKNGFDKYSLISALTLLSTFINVGIISVVIFNQTRYTIYNMPLFYISLLLMIYNVFIKKKEN